MTHRHDIIRAADDYAAAFAKNPCADACTDARTRVVQAVGLMEAEVRGERGERDRLASLIGVLGRHLSSAIAFGIGCRGGSALYKRGGQPKPGDLVLLTGTIEGDHRAVGWLREIVPSENKYRVVYVVEHLQGDVVQWSNVMVKAIPAGDVFGDLLHDVDAVFQPKGGPHA